MKRLLVTVDSLRHDHYRSMSNTRAFLGESHDRAFSTATATLGAFPTMMTGRYDANHSMDPAASFVHEIDDPSIGITTNRLTSAEYGYDGGFDTFVSPLTRGEESTKDRIASRISNDTVYRVAAKAWSLFQQTTPTDTPKSFRRADDAIEEFLAWTEGKGDWFGWLHLMEPHHPYDPDDSALSRAASQAASRDAIATNDPADPAAVRDLYRREVTETDEALAALWDAIPDDTRVVFAADHGELLGENGIWGHPGQTFHPDILRIPFATRNITMDSAVVSFIDIPALLLDRDWRESHLNRDIAFASMSGMKCAFNTMHMLTEDAAYALDGSDTEPSPRLRRALASFDPSQITKQDANREDLQALGYLDE